MDDPSLLPLLNNNTNGHHYSVDIEDEIEHEEDEFDDEVDDLHTYEEYPEDEIDDDDIDDEEILIPPPPPPPQQIIQSERGGRRKGVPRRLQLSPQVTKTAPAPQQRLLPLSLSKSSSSVHHHDQPILTSDQEEDDLNNENSIQFDFLSQHLIDHNQQDEYDENNNNSFNDEENIFEIVDDILADIVTIIVRDIRQQRNRNFKPQQRITNGKTNGYSNHKQQTNGLGKLSQKQEQRQTNGKHNINDLIQANR